MIKVRIMSLLIVCICGMLATSKNVPAFQPVPQYGYVRELPKSYNLRDSKQVTPRYVGEQDGVLILSNSPEVVKGEGLLYKEQAHGEGRLIVHHISEGSEKEPLRMVIRLENPTAKWTTCSITKNVVKGPCEDVLYTGQRLIYDYLDEHKEEQLIFEPYETKVLYESVEGEWQDGCAISGMIDFETQTPLEWSVLALSDEMNNHIEVSEIPLLDKDQHPRGTYDILEKTYKIKATGKEVEHFVIGERGSQWEEGVDALTEEVVSNRGEFGLLQCIEITAKQDVTLLMNPRGDLFKGAIKLGDEPIVLAPYKGELNGGNKFIVAGTIEKGETEELMYMLPNGSSAPVLFAIVPHNGKNVEKLNKL